MYDKRNLRWNNRILCMSGIHDENTKNAKKYRVVSLFSGIGGMDMGFHGNVVVHAHSINDFFSLKHATPSLTFPEFIKLPKLPFEIIFQNDILKGAKDVCSWNGFSADTYDTRNICSLLENDETFLNVHTDVVIGGFPCQDFPFQLIQMLHL